MTPWGWNQQSQDSSILTGWKTQFLPQICGKKKRERWSLDDKKVKNPINQFQYLNSFRYQINKQMSKMGLIWTLTIFNKTNKLLLKFRCNNDKVFIFNKSKSLSFRIEILMTKTSWFLRFVSKLFNMLPTRNRLKKKWGKQFHLQ
jgi:hypothetical protein